MQTPPTPINIAPVDAARWTLEFLNTAHIVGADFERFGIVRAFVTALVSGDLLITPKPPEPAAPQGVPYS